MVKLSPQQVDTWAAGLRAKGGGALESFGRSVAAALQTYGFYLTDNGGATAGIDMQAFETLSTDTALRSVNLLHPTDIRDMLDGLLSPGAIQAIDEAGPRLYR